MYPDAAFSQTARSESQADRLRVGFNSYVCDLFA